MKVSDIMRAIERVAPLGYQEEYDNAGLQVGFPDNEVESVLVCLDITEDIINEAAERGCSMVVSHHPLIFRPLRQVSDATYQQRCVSLALANGIALYSAHTNLDNARGGVNFEIADLLGLQNVEFLVPSGNEDAGSGIIGDLCEPEPEALFLSKLQDTFDVDCIAHTETSGRMISRVAVCGGAGAFLAGDARAAGADCFVTGELHYHDYFEGEGMLMVALGHYQSEQYTKMLLARILEDACPELDVKLTTINTNPIRYTVR